MWLVNVFLILAIIFFASCFFFIYGNELGKASNILIAGCQSILFVIFILLIQAIKALIIGAVVGSACGVIFKVAGAPMNTTMTAGITVGGLCFAWLTLKALLQEWNNLRWSIRHTVRNQYRKR